MHPDETTTKGYLPTGLYDKLKFLVLVVMPAFSTFYFTFGNIWEFPSVEKVIGSVTAAELFLGVVLGVSSASYNKSDARFDGQITLETDPGGISRASLNIDGDPETLLMQKDEITFKVQR